MYPMLDLAETPLPSRRVQFHVGDRYHPPALLLRKTLACQPRRLPRGYGALDHDNAVHRVDRREVVEE